MDLQFIRGDGVVEAVTGGEIALTAGIDTGGEIALTAGIDTGGEIALTAGIDTGGEIALTAGIDTGGEVRIDGPGSRLDSDGSLVLRRASALFQASDGATATFTRFLGLGGGSMRITGGSRLTTTEAAFPSVFDGLLELDDGVVATAGELEIQGTLRGQGRVEVGPGNRLRIAALAEMDPGFDGVGTLEVDTDLLLDEDSGDRGVLTLDVAALASADLVTVSGTATLEGEIAVRVGSSFTPEADDSFDVLIAAQILASGLDVTPGWTTSVVSLGGGQEALRLTFVPEPGTAGLLALGLAMLGGRRRR